MSNGKTTDVPSNRLSESNGKTTDVPSNRLSESNGKTTDVPCLENHSQQMLEVVTAS